MRLTFKKEERLYGHAALEHVYAKGKHLHVNFIKIIFIEVPPIEHYPCRVVFSVPKRNFKKAVDRNRIKRQMREIYRHHKENLYRHLTEKQKKTHIYLIYTSKQIMLFNELQTNIQQALNLLTTKM